MIAPNNLIFNSSKVGGIDDVYDGFDFDANARLGRGMIVSGGVSVGRERVNTCNLVDDLSLTQTGTRAANDPRTEEFCNVTPAVVAAGQGAGGVSAAVGHQRSRRRSRACSGPELRAQYPLTNAIALPSLGRNFTNVPPTVDLLPAGSLYGDRVYQTDLRFSKQIRYGGDDDPADGVDLQPVQRQPGADLHQHLRRDVADPDGDPAGPVRRHRRAGRLLERMTCVAPPACSALLSLLAACRDTGGS